MYLSLIRYSRRRKNISSLNIADSHNFILHSGISHSDLRILYNMNLQGNDKKSEQEIITKSYLLLSTFKYLTAYIYIYIYIGT